MTRLGKARRFWETIRHLKAEQVLHRVWFRFYRPSINDRPAPPMRDLSGQWTAPARRTPSMVGPEEFLFLNKRGNLADLNWDGDEIEKLWRYNQHYFDDLNAAGADGRSEWHAVLIARWIAENPPADGTGWEPYPASLRIVNWVKWALAGNVPSATFLDSLAMQTRWLSQRLERHLLGNHLFANAKALIFAGTLFGGDEGDAWYRKGTQILMRELPRQILRDGGHFELTPMYHALALEDVLDLINILRTGNRPRNFRTMCEDRVPAMQAWLAAMSHPDGDIAFFNDSALGVAPSPSELVDYSRRLGFAPTQSGTAIWLKDSGYACLAVGEALLLVDMAEVGPSYLPGHAHADSLSFELSLGSNRVLVNGGTSVYGLGEERLRQRGTAAHNCVVVEGRNSSDVWSGFRVGQRARPLKPSMATQPDKVAVEAGHDGYRSLPGAPVHWRKWSIDSRSLVIEDRVTNPRLHAEAHFHLHPEVVVEVIDADRGTLILPDGRRLLWRASHAGSRIVPDSWHPAFGISLASRSIVLPLREGRSSFEISWA